jgi:hypothetical protein
VVSRGCESRVEVSVAAKLRAFSYSARGARNRMEIDVLQNGELPQGRASLRGALNRLSIGGNGSIRCPISEMRGFGHEVDCD